MSFDIIFLIYIVGVFISAPIMGAMSRKENGVTANKVVVAAIMWPIIWPLMIVFALAKWGLGKGDAA